MKLHEIQEPERDFPSPFLNVIDMNDPLFQKWADLQDDVEDKLITRYADEHNIPRDKISVQQYGPILQAARHQYGTVTEVPLHALTSTETHLETAHVQRLMKGGAQSSSKLPIVYKMGKHLIIGDGNHRLAVQTMYGDTAKVLLLDLDKLRTV